MSSDKNKKQRSVTGIVKWFNQFKGYGFIEVDDISEDVFLHFSPINQSGIERLNNGDVILCEIEKSSKGYQVSKLLEVISYSKHNISEKSGVQVEAVMKWFNPIKGFGFAQMPSGKDVFIHSNLLKKNKIDSIPCGEKVTLVVRETNFGYEALEVVSI